jgi:hypothetical protein
VFLEKYIPMIMQSPAFQKDGMIQVIFDEAFPPYKMYGNSIADADFAADDAFGTDGKTGQPVQAEANTAQSVVGSGRPALAAAAVAGALLAGCTSERAPAAPDPDPSQVVASLGAVPIPPTGSTLPTPTEAVGHPAVLSMGEPVLLHLPGTEALVTALGPDQVVSRPQPDRIRPRPR